MDIKDIDELKKIAEKLIGGKPTKPETTDRIVAMIKYRDGSVLYVIYQVKD